MGSAWESTPDATGAAAGVDAEAAGAAETLANMAHAVEDVFFIFREDPSKLSIVQDSIFDLLFQASDFIKNEMDVLQGGSAEHQERLESVSGALGMDSSASHQSFSWLRSTAPAAAAPKAVKQNLISVNQIKLDHLMDLMGELVTTESMVVSSPDLKGLQLDNFSKVVGYIKLTQTSQ